MGRLPRGDGMFALGRVVCVNWQSLSRHMGRLSSQIKLPPRFLIWETRGAGASLTRVVSNAASSTHPCPGETSKSNSRQALLLLPSYHAWTGST